MSTIVELRTFAAIIESGSLVAAADRLNVTQSTVTARLKALEQSLGQTLVIRSKSGAQLTDAGTQMRKYALAILNLWRQAGEEVGQGHTQGATIAISIRLNDDLGQRLIHKVQQQAGLASLTHRLGSEVELAQWLTTGQVDACLGIQPIHGEGIVTNSWLDQELVLVGTSPDRSTRSDPGYTYVDYGPQFGLEHAVEYSDAGTAKVRTDSVLSAMQRLMVVGGSAYVPVGVLEGGRWPLYELVDAPRFRIRSFWSVRAESPLARLVLQNKNASPTES